MAIGKPEIVSAEEWEQARAELLAAEKEATRALDALAARRRRLPMTRFAADYVFDSPDGPKTLLDLFEGRRQLVVYQFMDIGPDRYCPGCTAFTDNIPDLKELASTGVSWTTVSNSAGGITEPCSIRSPARGPAASKAPRATTSCTTVTQWTATVRPARWARANPSLTCAREGKA